MFNGHKKNKGRKRKNGIKIKDIKNFKKSRNLHQKYLFVFSFITHAKWPFANTLKSHIMMEI